MVEVVSAKARIDNFPISPLDFPNIQAITQ